MQELTKVYNLTKSAQKYLPKYRLMTILENFLGAKYSSKDNLNTYSLKHFDCVTLVEIVLSLLYVKDFSSFESFKIDFEDRLMKMRYFDPSCDFIVRNHFISLDFLPNSKESLCDITNEIYHVKTSTTLIDKAAWFAKTHGLRNLNLPPVTIKVPYLDKLDVLDRYEQLRKYFPQISIVNIVRPDWNLKSNIGTNLDISHLGFAIKHSDKLMFYHASSINGKVAYEYLNDYIAKQLHIPSIHGINVQSIQEVV